MEKADVICFGYNGANNTGSEAKLLVTLADVKEVLGDRLGKLSCLTFNEENQRRYLAKKFPEVEIIEVTGPLRLKFRGFRLLDLIYRRRPEIIMLSEGSTFIDHFGSGFIWAFCLTGLIHKTKGLKLICYSNDCGELKRYNRWILRRTVNKADLVTLRNPDAVRRMKEYGVKKRIYCTADGAYRYPTPPKEYQEKVLERLKLDPKRRPIVGMCPKWFFNWPVKYGAYGPPEDRYLPFLYHSWPKGARNWNRKYIKQNALYADWCVKNLGANIALIAMEHMDLFPTRDIYNAMDHRSQARLIPSDEYLVDDIVSVLSALELLVTTRYHAHVLSSHAGVPMIAVSSDTRLEAVFRELKLMRYYNDYVDHKHPVPPKVRDLYSRLIDMTNSIWGQRKKMRKLILREHEEFVRRAELTKTLFARWFKQTYG